MDDLKWTQRVLSLMPKDYIVAMNSQSLAVLFYKAERLGLTPEQFMEWTCQRTKSLDEFALMIKPATTRKDSV